mmetsp:Transcript_124107/g.358886  ORF Transcript_124107/g.358886 Transcript_124107/m.358886 type:complete len:202 (-) Transcript_124107:401-1006(-)
MIVDKFSMSRPCCTHAAQWWSSEKIFGNVIPRSAMVASATVYFVASKDCGMHKSSHVMVRFSPTTSAHWRSEHLNEQSNVALRPSEYRNKAWAVTGTPSSVSSKKWQLTSCGNSQSYAQSVIRVQYQPKSPKHPKGSVFAFILMLLDAHSSQFPQGSEKELTTCLIRPSSPLCRSSFISACLGWCMSIVLSIHCTPASRQA